MKSLRERGEMPATVAEDGEVLVDDHPVGRLSGLTFAPASTSADAERRALNAAARRAVVPELRRRAAALIADPDDAFRLDDRGDIVWRGDAAVGRLLAGSAPLAPRGAAGSGDER